MIRYIYMRSKADKMASLMCTAQKQKIRKKRKRGKPLGTIGARFWRPDARPDTQLTVSKHESNLH